MRNEYVQVKVTVKRWYIKYIMQMFIILQYLKKNVLVIALDGLNCSRSWSSNLKVKSYLCKRHFLKGMLQATFTSNSHIENIKRFFNLF